MSVIAWDGKYLAADRRAMVGSLIRTTSKLSRVRNALLAYCGEADAGEELLEWFAAGADPDKFPSVLRDKDMRASLMAVFPNGAIWMYERSPWPMKFPPQQFAIGSGRDFALAAMHLGATAEKAVEVASVFDSTCGGGVDFLTHQNGDPA